MTLVGPLETSRLEDLAYVLKMPDEPELRPAVEAAVVALLSQAIFASR
jgi:hypothetical protein